MAVTSERKNKQQHLPVLILPGFMSSGLTIQKSPHKSWEGKRLWLNISSAGFNSLHVGGALRKNEQRRSTMNLMGDDGRKKEPLDPSSEEMQWVQMMYWIHTIWMTIYLSKHLFHIHSFISQEYKRQLECKSRWLWHMRLQSDMLHEKEGVEVVSCCILFAVYFYD